MRKFLPLIALATLAGGALMPLTATAQQAAPVPAGHYSVTETKVGTLLDDPAAAEVLKRLIPGVYANDMFQTMGRTQTLKGVQQFEPDALSDAILASIQAEFDKLPATK